MYEGNSSKTTAGDPRRQAKQQHRVIHWLGAGVLLFAFSCLFVAVSFASIEDESIGRQWFVTIGGNDIQGVGTTGDPLRTIQRAIDLAQDGDAVIVAPGLYKGPGNEDFDFSGRSIAIRSEDPSEPALVRETIIWATDNAVIARFVHDETAQTILEGFTLRRGSNASTSSRGVSGYFTFSHDARPTIRHTAGAGEKRGHHKMPSADSG